MKRLANDLRRGSMSLMLTAAALIVAPTQAADDPGGAAAGSPPAATAAPATSESQRQAAELLKSMTVYLAGLQSFSVNFRDGYDVVQSTGQKIEFGETRRVMVARPDHLRVEQVASDGKSDLAIFDGRNIFVLDADANVYAQAPQPATFDDALAYFVRDLRMRMPLALLLATRLPEVLPGRVKSIDYVESTSILGVPTHHIAGRTDSVDFQCWITSGAQPLPLRIVITYRHAPGEPQFRADLANWNTRPQFAKGTFQFVPPKEARPIAFAVQVSRAGDPGQAAAVGGQVLP